MFGLKNVAPGYGIRELSRGKLIIKTEIEKQLFRRSACPCCIRCGKVMSGPTLYTADAGQAFEMIKPDRIERAFRIIFRGVQIVSGKTDPTISCMHTAKSKARFGGWIQENLFDRSVFFLSKVSKCMRSLLQLRWFKFGNKYLFQKSGIPIGGPVSGASLEAVLCVDEDMFDKLGWYSFSKKLGISGERIDWLAIVRYVDDVFVATRWFCPKCVEYFVFVIYSNKLFLANKI